MPESRFLKIVIVALLLLNVGTLGYLWMSGSRDSHHRPPPPRDGGPPPGGPGCGENTAEYLRRSLQLSDAEEDQYRNMREQHHEQVMEIREGMRDQKRRLYAMLQSTDTVSAVGSAAPLLDSLGASQRRIELITFMHFRELRSILNTEQQKKFDAVIGEALERMR